jgi:hypothetical protein
MIVSAESEATLSPYAYQIQQELGLDPATILLIIQALITLLELVQDCRTKYRVGWRSILKNVHTEPRIRRCKRAIDEELGKAAWGRLGGRAFVWRARDIADGTSTLELNRILETCVAA